MTLKEVNGKIDWRVVISIVSVAVMILTIITYTSGFQSRLAKIDEVSLAVSESKIDRNLMHVQIATLQECARNTEAKLERIEQKVDSLLMGQRAIRSNGK